MFYLFSTIPIIIRISTIAAKHLKKTNTSVPSMFQGLLNIEGIWVQHRVSPEPFDVLLWNINRMLLIYKTFIWTNSNKNSQLTVGGHSGSNIKNMKNAYKQLFYAIKIKRLSTPSIKHKYLLWYYIVSSEINQIIAVEGLNESCMSFPWTCFRCFWPQRNLMTLQTFL